jgi:DNA polymerase-3 subunit beta
MSIQAEPLTATLDLRTLAVVSTFCSNEETRYYLKGVLVEVGPTGVTYVATDGQRLAARRVALPPDLPPNTLIGRWIIPVEDCRALKPGRRGEGQALLTPAGNNLLLTYEGKPRLVQPIDGTFPDWRRIIPNKTTGKLSKLTMQGKYFAAVWALGEALGIGMPIAHWNDDGGPVPFTFADDTAFCLVMPMREKENNGWSAPSWLNKEAA